MAEKLDVTGSLIASVSRDGCVVIGMKGPYMVFDSQSLAADYVENFSRTIRDYVVGGSPSEARNEQ